jgi:hypothetical protein
LKRLFSAIFRQQKAVDQPIHSDPSILNNSDRLKQEFVRMLYDVMILASFNKDSFEIVDVKLMNNVLKELSMENLNKDWLLNRILVHQNQTLSLSEILNDFKAHLSKDQQELLVSAALIITRTDNRISEKNLQLLLELGQCFKWEASRLKAFITKAL